MNTFSKLCLLCLLSADVNAWGLSKSRNIDSRLRCDEASQPSAARRSLLNSAVASPFVFSSLLVPFQTANASGGATAGGAYLLSAKQRYNERVKESVKGLLAVAKPLAAGDSKPAKEYFSSDAAGSWKDLTAAGYLLSNAFRRNSSASPDSLPSVKKYKAFAAEVDGLQKVLKKKGAAAASEGFASVEAKLEDWLAEIDLPSPREL